MDESEKLRLVETLKFQIDEIERAELQSGEEDELLERRKVLQNAEKLTDAMESAVSALYGDETSDGAAAMIANAAHALERVSRVSDEMRQLSGKLSDLMYTAQDIADELRDKKDDLTYSADELEQIEERLDTLHKLKRKYGGSVEDVIAFCERRSGSSTKSNSRPTALSSSRKSCPHCKQPCRKRAWHSLPRGKWRQKNYRRQFLPS